MIKDISELITVEEEITISQEVICDVCKKLILTKKIDTKHSNKLGLDKIIAKHPHHISYGHYEWGNDSIESIKSFDVCSDECLATIFCDYLDNFSKQHRSAYIEIENLRY